MPYETNGDLPSSVRSHLPPHAQDIYRSAFNNAFVAHAGEADQEQRAHRIAWAAVKHSYVKVGDSGCRAAEAFCGLSVFGPQRRRKPASVFSLSA